MVTNEDGHITQNVVYIPFGEVFVEERNGSWASPYLFNAKELDEETGLYYYGARYLDPAIALWLSTDPLQGKYPGMSPYNYCAGNPVKLVDPDGEAWKPVGDMEGNPTGYVWVNPKDSYEKDGKLKKGLYEQAIYFSHGGKNGYYLSSNNGYNMGTSTATVYKADGSTEDYDACTFPANTEKYATVPQGKFEAKVGMHNSKYLALRLSEKGTKNFIKNFINLFSQNPSKRNRTNYAYGINIHKAGKKQLHRRIQEKW